MNNTIQSFILNHNYDAVTKVNEEKYQSSVNYGTVYGSIIGSICPMIGPFTVQHFRFYMLIYFSFWGLLSRIVWVSKWATIFFSGGVRYKISDRKSLTWLCIRTKCVLFVYFLCSLFW